MAHLNRLLELAQEHRLPGVDKASIETLKGNIRAERFSTAHYITLFENRLTEAGVTAKVRTLPPLVKSTRVPLIWTLWRNMYQHRVFDDNRTPIS